MEREATNKQIKVMNQSIKVMQIQVLLIFIYEGGSSTVKSSIFKMKYFILEM